MQELSSTSIKGEDNFETDLATLSNMNSPLDSSLFPPDQISDITQNRALAYQYPQSSNYNFS